MKRFFNIVLILVFFSSCGNVGAFELSMQQKIDAVNSYQPTQFAAQNAEILKNRREYENTNFPQSILNTSFIEALKIDEDYESDSPVAKEAVTNLSGDPYAGPSSPIANPSAFDDMALAGEIQEKVKRPLFSKYNWDRVKTAFKGEPAYDSILIGMQAVHTDPHRDMRNDTNNMLALQYGGVAIGTFENSWYKQTCFAVCARRMWKKQLNKDVSIDFQYKAGFMHGYENHAPIRFGWLEPIILPIVGLNYKSSGADFWIIPSNYPVFAVNFRVGIPNAITYKSVQSHIQTNYEKHHPPKPKQPKETNENIYEQIDSTPKETL